MPKSVGVVPGQGKTIPESLPFLPLLLILVLEIVLDEVMDDFLLYCCRLLQLCGRSRLGQQLPFFVFDIVLVLLFHGSAHASVLRIIEGVGVLDALWQFD
jgi:hypothetical protein